MADKSFGRVIEGRRRELGLTQETVAKKVGVRANYIGYLERGMRHPSQACCRKIINRAETQCPGPLPFGESARTLAAGQGQAGCAQRLTVATVHPECFSPTEKRIEQSRTRRPAQIARAEKATSMTGVIKAVRALRKGFRAERPGQRA